MTTLELPSITTTEPTVALDAPEWFTKLQKEAWAEYQALPMPTNRDETWRFGNRKQLAFEDYVPAALVDEADIDIQIDGLEEAAAQFIFANDGLVHAEADLPDGVICLPLEDALQQHSDLLEKHFAQCEARLGSAKFAALHKANVTNGMFVYVPKGVEVEKPIEVYHILAGDKSTIFPHTLIITEDLAKVTVVDYFKSAGGDAGLCIAMNDLIAGPASKLNYVAIQDLNLESKMILINGTSADRDSNPKSFILNVGAKWARNESISKLIDKGAHSDMLSINIPTGTQEYDQRTFQEHAAPHTYSDLLYKNTLYGKAKTTFSGLISVDAGAHFTDAYQTCRNLLMEDTTEANSMPGLQINADQVKCSHGSTSAAISDDEIFYLCARGVRPKTARQLIARGFSVEAVERLENDALEALVLKYMDAKYDTVA